MVVGINIDKFDTEVIIVYLAIIVGLYYGLCYGKNHMDVVGFCCIMAAPQLAML